MNDISLLSFGAAFLSTDTGLDSSLSEFMGKLTDLMDTIWPWIIAAMIAVVVVWGAYIGIRIAIAHRNEDQVNARAMVKNLVIGVIVMFVIAVGAPLIIQGLAAWCGTDVPTTGAAIPG